MNLIYFLIRTLLKYENMNIKTNLVDTRLNTNNAISLYTIDDRSIPDVHNLSKEILYESLISVDSILFLVETNVIGLKQLNKFLESTVLKSKKLLLTHPDLLKHYTNFSTNLNIKNDKLKHILEIRNKIFAIDKSQIARVLTLEKLTELQNRLRSKLILFDENKDEEYKRMIKALIDTKNSDDGVQVNLSKEKFEFYRENINILQQEVLDAKMSLNLGGGIFSPSLLINLIKQMTIYNKRELLKTTISAMFDTLDQLHKNTIGRSYMTKKKEIMEYLVNCLEIKNSDYRNLIDIAFYNRTLFIEYYFKDNPRHQELNNVLDKEQEKHIRKLIYTFENMNESQLKHVIFHSSTIKKTYLEYLCDGQDSKKEALYKLFKTVI